MSCRCVYRFVSIEDARRVARFMFKLQSGVATCNTFRNVARAWGSLALKEQQQTPIISVFELIDMASLCSDKTCSSSSWKPKVAGGSIRERATTAQTEGLEGKFMVIVGTVASIYNHWYLLTERFIIAS